MCSTFGIIILHLEVQQWFYVCINSSTENKCVKHILHFFLIVTCLCLSYLQGEGKSLLIIHGRYNSKKLETPDLMYKLKSL